MSTTTPDVQSLTLTNLLAAYEGESNASLKYSAFAIQAEVEGYLKVAALFRAAARAEQVHAAHHARIILRMGGKPKATLTPVGVRSTRENLEMAKAGEDYEVDVMYPGFIKEAEGAGNKDAVRAFTLAIDAEKVHAHLYGEALRNLEAQRAAATYYVCLVCGDVSDKAEESCPLCKSPKERFLAVK